MVVEIDTSTRNSITVINEYQHLREDVIISLIVTRDRTTVVISTGKNFYSIDE